MATIIHRGPFYWPPEGVIDERSQPACPSCGEVIEHGDEYVMVGSCCIMPAHAHCATKLEVTTP